MSAGAVRPTGAASGGRVALAERDGWARSVRATVDVYPPARHGPPGPPGPPEREEHAVIEVHAGEASTLSGTYTEALARAAGDVAGDVYGSGALLETVRGYERLAGAVPRASVVAGAAVGPAVGGGAFRVTGAVGAVHTASLAPATARPLSPWVGVGYQDKAGRPVTGWHYRADGGRQRDGQLGTGGQVWLDGLAGGGAVEVGLVGVYGCRWERDEARVGEAVGMSARCVGIADGAVALFEVWREVVSADGSARRETVWEGMGEAEGGRVEAMRPFVYAWPEAERPGGADSGGVVVPSETETTPVRPVDAEGGEGRDRLSGAGPVYAVEVSVGGVHRARGGPLRYQDWVEIEFADADGRAAPHTQYRVRVGNGEVRSGVADASGTARLDRLPPGEVVLLPFSVRRGAER